MLIHTPTQKYFARNIEQNSTKIISFLFHDNSNKIEKKSAYKNWDFIDLKVSSNDM